MRQRLDSDRYRGKRRAPTPPRTRYAAVLTTAVVGAGVVAASVGAAIPDTNSLLDPQAQLALDGSVGGSGAGDAFSGRLSTADDRATRSGDRAPAPGTTMSTLAQPAPDVWLLPLKAYSISSAFGQRWGTLHPGVDLAIGEGTPYYATHAGTVKLARWNGGYGYCVIVDVGNGVEILFGHSSKLVAREGQKVQAGDLLGFVGNTGYSFGPHLHYEVRQNNAPIDPMPFMRSHGVDIGTRVIDVYRQVGDLANSLLGNDSASTRSH